MAIRNGVGLALLAAFAISVLSGIACDPTEDLFAITVRNDTANVVELGQCDTGPDCRSFHEHPHLDPGGRTKANVSRGNVLTWWRVFDANNNTIGCLRLQFADKQSGVVVPISSVVQCPDH